MKSVVVKGVAIGGARALGALLGLFYTFMLAWTLGAGNISDALFAAFIIPIGLCQNMPTIIGQVIIPYLTQQKENTDISQFMRSVSTIIWLTGLLCMFFYLIFPSTVIFLTAGGLNSDASNRALYFLKVLAPIFPNTLICGYFQAYLNSQRIFLPVEISILLWKTIPAFIIGISLITSFDPALCAVWGLTLGSFVRMFFLCYKTPSLVILWLLSPSMNLAYSFPRKIKSFFVAESILIGADWALIVFVRFLGSMLPFGGLSIYNYAEKISYTFPVQIIKGLGTVLLPDMAKERATTDRNIFPKVLLVCVILGTLLSVAVYLFASFVSFFFVLHTDISVDFRNSLTSTIEMFAPSIFAMIVTMGCQITLFLNYRKVTFLIGNLLQACTILLLWWLLGLPSSTYLAAYLSASMYIKMIFFLFMVITGDSRQK